VIVGRPVNGWTILFTGETDGETAERFKAVYDGKVINYNYDNDRSPVALSEVDFAAKKKRRSKAKPKKCVKGKPCGNGCIAKTKNCRIQPTGAIKAAADALAGVDDAATTQDIDQIFKDLLANNLSWGTELVVSEQILIDRKKDLDSGKTRPFEINGQSQDIPPPPPLERLAAIYSYTGESYAEINVVLRGQIDRAYDPDDFTPQERADLVKDTKNVAAIATDALMQLKPYQGTVWRGANLTQDQQASYKPGSIVQYDGFTSTSGVKGREWEGNTQYVIQSKNGRYIADFSRHSLEHEVLFAPGARFKVMQADRDPGNDDLTVYLEEI